MNVNKISLQKRLERLRKGYASDPEYDASVIRSWALIPICDYMAAFEQEYERLRELLDITETEAMQITYQDAAVKIHSLLTTAEHNATAREAMRLLALPFKRCYNERKRYYV